ncbi:MAG: hypothetical protein HIU88_06580 [Acidobacteria bacterium]|nr:hypothetical protein [Acidobacteriota bacterium]
MTATPMTWPTVPARWRGPLTAVFAALAAVGIVVNTLVATSVASQPLDFTFFGKPGADLLLGQWTGMYQDPLIQAGPFELAFWGIPWLLGVAGTAAWSTFCIVAAILLSVALFAVCRWLLRTVTPSWSTPLAAGVTAFAALGLVTTRSLSSGHPAEFAIPLMWVVAAQLARRDRPLAAAAILAATTGWEVWGVLGVPLLLLAPRIDGRTIWRSALGGIGVLALLYLPFFLLGPMRMFAFAWPIYPGTLAHLLFPGIATFSWPMRLAQGVLAVGAGATMAMLLRRRADAVWLSLLAVCVIRLFLDPVLAGYYVIPPEMLALLGAAFAIAQRALPTLVLCVAMANVLTDARLTLLSASILVVLTAATAVVVTRRDGTRQNAVDRTVSGSPTRG